MARKRNGWNDPRATQRREAAYLRGGTLPARQDAQGSGAYEARLDRYDQFLDGDGLDDLREDPHREDDQLKCKCGVPRWEHPFIVMGHEFQEDPIQDWAVSRKYAEWIGSAGLEDFYSLPD